MVEEENMSIRCAMCGSKNVRTETKQEGYNKKKGILGVALFGGIGALAGTSGNTVTYYHCAECQHVLNRCMPEFDKFEIETALSHPDISVEGLIRWKKKYKNIEWEKSETLIANEPTSNNDFDEEFIESVEKRVLECLEHNKDSEIIWKRHEIAKKLAIEWDKFHPEIIIAFKNLCDRGVIKSQQGYFYLASGIDEEKAVEKIQKKKTIEKTNFDIKLHKAVNLLKIATCPITINDIKNEIEFRSTSIQEIVRIFVKLKELGIVEKNYVFEKRETYYTLVEGLSDEEINDLLEEN